MDDCLNYDIENLIKAGWINNDNIFHMKYINPKTKKELSICDLINFENIQPVKNNIFNAFKKDNKIINPSKIKILILGQDPYPSKGKNVNRAHGYAFSFGNNDKPADDSLLNIFKAIQAYKTSRIYNQIEDNEVSDWDTNLKNWVEKNGIQLLNTALTYDNKNSCTERKNTWSPFISEVIKNLLTYNNSKLAVFLWGNKARDIFQKVIFEINSESKVKRDLFVLSTSHPSPLGVKYGFSDDAPNHFEACDKFLFENNESKYIWKNFPEK